MIQAAAIVQYNEENLKLKQAIEQKTGRTAESLYLEREKRVRDAITLQMPDRVPFAASISVHSYTGISKSAPYYDPIGWKSAMRKIAVDFEPDMCDAGLPSSGVAMEALEVTNRLWPGGPVPPDWDYQFIEGEYMKQNEYDLFLSDPTGFMLRCYLPRIYTAVTPLAKLPSMDSLYQGFEMFTTYFATPEFQEMTSRLAEAGRHTAEFRKITGDAYEELAQLGFPAFAPVAAAGVGGAPFDTISSFLRGMKGSMLDMYRQPDKLLKACDVILDRKIAAAHPADPAKRGNPKKVGMPLWRGDKAFMSESQFKKFYWPGLKRALQATIDLGYVPVPFFEDEFGDRLECLLELPKGKMVASVEPVDAVKAREILAGHTCVYIRNPVTSKLWSLPQIESYTKEIIHKCGKNGGLMINIRFPDNARTADIQAVLKSIQEYSRY
jgi:hypothetical protein